MKKANLFRQASYLLVAGIACGALLYSPASRAISRSDFTYDNFVTQLKKAYPAVPFTPKDWKALWNYGIKKIRFQKISPNETRAFKIALGRTGVTTAIVLAIIGKIIHSNLPKITSALSELFDEQEEQSTDTSKLNAIQFFSSWDNVEKHPNNFILAIKEGKILYNDKNYFGSSSFDNFILYQSFHILKLPQSGMRLLKYKDLLQILEAFWKQGWRPSNAQKQKIEDAELSPDKSVAAFAKNIKAILTYLEHPEKHREDIKAFTQFVHGIKKKGALEPESELNILAEQQPGLQKNILSVISPYIVPPRKTREEVEKEIEEEEEEEVE